jgi:hypothetical protein
MRFSLSILIRSDFFAPPTQATDTRLLAQPAVSATRVAFHAGDLWSPRIDGTDARR